jgi:SPP1 family predicted phage head-tail adaptor
MARQKYKRTEPVAIWRKDRQFTLQEWTETGTSDRGHSEGSWGNLATDPTVWASIEPLNTTTAEYAHQLYAEATHRVLIDYRTDVTRGMRVVYGSRTLDIGHVTEVGDARVTLELMCRESDPYGN